jgi:hypothetical protein
LVSEIPAGDGKISNFFYSVQTGGWKEENPNSIQYRLREDNVMMIP